MPKPVESFRLSGLAVAQLNKLQQHWGTSRTETITVIIDRAFNAEFLAPLYEAISQMTELRDEMFRGVLPTKRLGDPLYIRIQDKIEQLEIDYRQQANEKIA